MLGIKRTGAIFLVLFVLTQIVILSIAFISFIPITVLLDFLFTYADGIALTLFGHLFLWIFGLLILIIALAMSYFRLAFSYVPAFISAISLGLMFSMSYYLALVIGFIP